MSADHVELAVRGETVHLLADKALWWPARGMLMVADAHFGKAATYRVLGQPVPHGTTQDNLDRLDAVLARLPVATLVFLGDLLHGPELRRASSTTLAAMQAWRERHASLRCVLLRGNHDARAGDPPAALNIETVAEPWREGPFALCHHPGNDATHYVVAGHLHPAFTLRGPGRDRLRLPCFAVSEQGMILPAFGAFTGAAMGEPPDACDVYAVGGGAVWQVRRARG